MNKYTEEMIGYFMGILKALKVPKVKIFGIVSFLKTEDMMMEMVEKLEQSGPDTTPEEAEQICLEVIVKYP